MMEQPVAQILVVVASIQLRTLKTEVGKGSRPTAVGPGLASPEGSGNSVTNGRLWCLRVLVSPAMIPKGNPVKILEPCFGL